MFWTFLGWLAAAFAASEKVITVATLVISCCVTTITQTRTGKGLETTSNGKFGFPRCGASWLNSWGRQWGRQSAVSRCPETPRHKFQHFHVSPLKHREFNAQSVKNGAKWVLFIDEMICEVQWTLMKASVCRDIPHQRSPEGETWWNVNCDGGGGGRSGKVCTRSFCLIKRPAQIWRKLLSMCLDQLTQSVRGEFWFLHHLCGLVLSKQLLLWWPPRLNPHWFCRQPSL